MFYLNFDYMIFMIPAFILMLVTQWYVNSAYKKWSEVRNSNNMTGFEVAEALIRYSGLDHIRIETVSGRLSDHYDPRSNTLRLSSGVANTPSIAAAAIAAHELGHAMQDQENYLPLRFRSALVPMVNIGSYLGWIMLFGGLLLGLTELAWLGLAVFSGGAVFALATLPVELNASSRAKRLLEQSGIIQRSEERAGVNRVLNAAALTYVAALITAVMQILYYASLLLGRRRR